MPRKRKASRMFAQPATASVAAMRKRYENPFALLHVASPHWTFFDELATVPERRLFARAYPDQFYRLFGFFASEFNFKLVERLFTRPAAEFIAALEKRPPRRPFDPPDIRALPYPEQDAALARARGEWWQANRLPMTAEEREWLNAAVAEEIQQVAAEEIGQRPAHRLIYAKKT